MSRSFTIHLRHLYLSMSLLGICAIACGQAPKARTLLIGQAAFYTDYYQANNFSLAYAIYRRPTLLNRLVLTTQLNRGKFDCITNVMLTTPYSRADRIPIGSTDLQDYLLRPGNTVSIQPSFRKLRLLIGNHMPTLSPLSTGNIANALGTGIEFTPGWLRLKAYYGITHRPITEVPFVFAGQYERRMFCAQVGLGDDSKSHLRFNFVKIWDIEPMGQAFANRPPVEGQVFSVAAKLRPKKLPFYGHLEAALAAYSDNQNDTCSANDRLDGLPFYRSNGSTVGDAAIDAEIVFFLPNWDFTIGAKYIGANFRNLAYLYFVTGYLDLTNSMNLQWFKNRLQLHALGGVRRTMHPIDAVDGKAPLSDQAIVKASGHLQLTKHLGFDGHFSNYAWQDPTLLGPYNIQQTVKSQGIATTLQLGRKSRHLFSGNASYDQFRNIYGGNTPGDAFIQARVYGFHYQLQKQNQSGFTLGGNYFDYQGNLFLPLYDFANLQWNAYTGIQKTIFKGHFQFRAQLQCSWQQPAIALAPDMIATNLCARMKLGKKLLLTSEYNRRQQEVLSSPVHINFVRSSIQYQF